MRRPRSPRRRALRRALRRDIAGHAAPATLSRAPHLAPLRASRLAVRASWPPLASSSLPPPGFPPASFRRSSLPPSELVEGRHAVRPRQLRMVPATPAPLELSSISQRLSAAANVVAASATTAGVAAVPAARGRGAARARGAVGLVNVSSIGPRGRRVAVPHARSRPVTIPGRCSFKAVPAVPSVLVVAPRLAIVRRSCGVGVCDMGRARLRRVALLPPPLQPGQPRIIDRSSAGLSQCQSLTPAVK